MFLRFDSDRSNTIDLGEFLNLLDYLHSSGAVQGAKMGRENASAVFAALDGNRDGRLTRQVGIHDDVDGEQFILENACARCGHHQTPHVQMLLTPS